MLPAESVRVHRPGVPLDVAAMFDTFGNAVHVADAFPLRDRTVLVTGAGPIGSMAAAVARHRGARLIVVSDLSPFRLGLAWRAGARSGRIAAMAHGGRIAALGLPDEDVPTDWSDISLRMLTIQGISGRKVFDTWHTMADLLDDGLDLSFAVTDHFAAPD
ncbi:hypothetical protein [Streptomyces sp. NPDC056987]|uniref:hypothetical protein n=1 Tax=Streptomyces sp. NPDC056987 TaxID=3345988 RepID=UPI00362AE0FE